MEDRAAQLVDVHELMSVILPLARRVGELDRRLKQLERGGKPSLEQSEKITDDMTEGNTG